MGVCAGVVSVNPTGLAQHRKLFVLVGSMLLTFTLNRMGLDAKELLGSAGEPLVEGLVDLLIIGGIPAVLTWAQPNEEDQSIFRWWKAVTVGVVIVAGSVTLITLAS